MQAMQKPYGGRDQEISSSRALLGVLLASGLRNVHSTPTQHRTQDRYSTLTHPPPTWGNYSVPAPAPGEITTAGPNRCVTAFHPMSNEC